MRACLRLCAYVLACVCVCASVYVCACMCVGILASLTSKDDDDDVGLNVHSCRADIIIRTNSKSVHV